MGEPPLFIVSICGATSSSVHEVNAIAEKEAKRMMAISFFMSGVFLKFNKLRLELTFFDGRATVVHSIYLWSYLFFSA
jgi:hypothetical protein